MAGLDSVQKFEDGGTVGVKETTKGQPQIAGTIPLDPTQTAELLKGMQEMLDQRTGAMSTFLGGLKDATAWTAGGAQGPSSALAERDRQKLVEQQDLQSIRNQMAMYKSAAAQQEAAKAQFQNMPGQGGAGGAGGTSPIPGLSNDQIKMIADDPLVKQRLAALPAWDYAGKLAIIADAAKTEFGNASKARYEAAGGQFAPVFIKELGGNRDLLPHEARAYAENGTIPKRLIGEMKQDLAAPTTTTTTTTTPAAPTSGVSANNVGNVRPVGQSTGFQQPKDLNEGLQIMDKNLQAYASKGINTLAGVISRWAPPSENDTPALIKAAANRLGIDPNQPIDLNNAAVRQAVGTAIMLQEKGPQGIFGSKTTGGETANVAAPVRGVVSPTANVPYPNPKNAAEVKANEAAITKSQEKQTDVEAKSTEEERTSAGKLISGIQTRAAKAQETIEAADRVIKHASERPEEFGYGKQSNVRGYGLNILGGIPKIGPGLKETGEEITALAQGAGSRRDVTNSDASKLGFEFANEVFAGSGARLGVGLEQMAAKAKGVGTEHSAETNLLNARLIKIAAEKARAQSEAWDTYKKDAKARGVNADPYEFTRSSAYKKIEHDAEQSLRRDLPQFFNDQTIGASAKRGTTGAPKRPLSDFNKSK
jgi:hypothetical protein